MSRAFKIFIKINEDEAQLIEKLVTRLKIHKLRRSLSDKTELKSYITVLFEALYLSLQRDL
jgi:hypothetical protein